jgi:hypothetical protein
MVGVEDYCAFLDCVAGVCAVCVDDFEAEVKVQWSVVSGRWSVVSECSGQWSVVGGQ